MHKQLQIFIATMLITALAAVIALPKSFTADFSALGFPASYAFQKPPLVFNVFGKTINFEYELRQGLDIRGGMQVVLQADMSEIATPDRMSALESAREIIIRRVDLYGLTEPTVKTSIAGEEYRIIVELPGVEDPQAALDLVGQTASLSFALIEQIPTELLENSDEALQNQIFFEPTELSGKQLRRSTVQFDPTTGEPLVGLEFDAEGTALFADITTKHTGKQLAILLDDVPLMAPTIQVPIVTGQATITGGFTLEEAQKMSVQLNAGALPVPITVLQQKTVAATLGAESVSKSIYAGTVGVLLVMLFMILHYGSKGVLASIALIMYAIITVALYKVIGVTITLPGIAGLLLSIGMAVDANILIFERMKEELRLGRPFAIALELGFGKAWDSIKDANLATIVTALILINPFDFPFLNSAGLVRGFGITLLIGVLLSLFTGVVITRTLMRLFLKET